jgi:hypothetical protein
MEIRKQKIGKLYSQSAILTIGTIFITVALFLFKVVFYQFSEEDIYSEFILAYSLFLFYAIFGYLNVGNPLSNDAYKSLKDEEKSIKQE